ncbi:hypothetical protein SAMN05414139_10602 [Burkholderia sp. D7]|nr:hypothetical protein SAMN05414139_10602 [Burkholderia sp. D7]
MHFETIPNEKNARLVFGLEWRAYATKGGAAERRRYAQEFDATHFVEIKGKEETIAGFCAPDAVDRKGSKLYSAAARIALLDRVKKRPAVLVLVQDEQRVHLVLVIRGAVRADEEVRLLDLETRRVAIEDQCEKDSVELVTFGHGTDLIDLDQPFALQELLRAKKSGLIKKVPVKVPAILPLIVIGGAVIYGISQLISVLNPPPPPLPPPPTFMQEYQSAVLRALAGPAPIASVLAPKLIASFAAQETNSRGWQFDRAMCGITGACTVIYKREGGTFKDFDSGATPEMRPVLFDPDGLHLSTRGPSTTVTEKVVLAKASSWPSEQALIKQLQTDPQRLSAKPDVLDSHGYVVTLRPPQRLLARQPMPGEVRGPIVQIGDWEISGYMWQSVLLTRLPSSMALNTLDVELKDDGAGVHFTAKGKYYVLQ